MNLGDLFANFQLPDSWPLLERLLAAPAPSAGAGLPGGVGDVIAEIMNEFGVEQPVEHNFEDTGNTALWLGIEKDTPDVLVVAHMDRPSFRVRDVENGALYPICANRFPDGAYETGARAVRFEGGGLVTSAWGTLVSVRDADGDTLRFETDEGTLGPDDTILLHVEPTLADKVITGTGLDNALGTLIAILAAVTLDRYDDRLIDAEKACLFVWTDQEEGPPDGFFGHGASRLTYAVPPPRVGVINIDGHNDNENSRRGNGVSYAFVSGDGKGAVVPLHFQALMNEMADTLREVHGVQSQRYTGYLSRSDDMMLSRYSRMLALLGPPIRDAHTGHESAHMMDVEYTVRLAVPLLLTALGQLPTDVPLNR